MDPAPCSLRSKRYDLDLENELDVTSPHDQVAFVIEGNARIEDSHFDKAEEDIDLVERLEVIAGLEYARAAVARGKAEVGNWFGYVPDAPMIVKPSPAYERDSGGGFYSSGRPQAV